MTILFAGTEMDAFLFSVPPAISTTNTFYDPTYVRLALAPIGGSLFKTPKWTPPVGDDLWMHFDVRLPGNGGDGGVYFNDASGVSWIRYHTTSGSTLRFSVWNGSAWTELGLITNSELQSVDVHFRNTVDGKIALYSNNFLLASITGDFSARPDIVEISVSNRTSSNPLYLSQFIVADEPTLGFKLAYRQPTGAGNYTAWNGIWSDVDDTVVNDVSSVNSGVADQRESFTKALFTTPQGNTIRAVGITARARRGTTGLQNLALMLRFGSTDYDSADKPLELGFNPVQAFWYTNPATGIAWVPADAGSATLEFGLKART